jgi:hypothetical protein
MDALPELFSSPDNRFGSRAIGHAGKSREADLIGWKFVQLQAFTFVAAVCTSYYHNNPFYGYAYYLPSSFLMVLVWARTLDACCSLWPFRVACFLVAATVMSGFYACPFNIVDIPATDRGYRQQAIWTPFIFFALFGCYKGFVKFRRCLQTQYKEAGNMLRASRQITYQFLGLAGGMICILTYEEFSALNRMSASID